MPEYETEQIALAQAHMVRQVEDFSKVSVALATAFDRFVDPGDLSGSFIDYRNYAYKVLGLARQRGEITADRYYLAAKTLSGLTATMPEIQALPLNQRKTDLDLLVNGPILAKQKIASGMSPEAATAAAKVTSLAVAKRLTLDAPRTRLIRLSEADSDSKVWARVSDGAPCHFCAMLVSRGPVYRTQGTANFHPHNGCGCSVRSVFRNARDKGWSPDSRALRELWDASDGDVNTFRRNYEKAMRTAGATLSDLHGPLELAA